MTNPPGDVTKTVGEGKKLAGRPAETFFHVTKTVRHAANFFCHVNKSAVGATKNIGGSTGSFFDMTKGAGGV